MADGPSCFGGACDGRDVTAGSLLCLTTPRRRAR